MSRKKAVPPNPIHGGETFEERVERFLQVCAVQLPAMERRIDRPERYLELLEKQKKHRLRVMDVQLDWDSLSQFSEKYEDLCIAFVNLFPETHKTLNARAGPHFVKRFTVKNKDW